MPYYCVTLKNTGEKRIVEAINKTKAYRVVGNRLLEVEVAPASEVVKYVEAGGAIMRESPAGDKTKL